MDNINNVFQEEENTVYLQYIWISDFRCLKNYEVSFSSKFNITYDGIDKLTISLNEKYTELFENDNVNLTCVVGKNGTGKSTLLKYLHSTISSDFGVINKDSIFVFIVMGKLYIYYNFKEKMLNIDTSIEYRMFNISNNSGHWKDRIIWSNSLYGGNEFNNKFDFSTIYFSNALDYDSYTSTGMYHSDQSTSGLMYRTEYDIRLEQNNKYRMSVGVDFFHSEFTRIIELLDWIAKLSSEEFSYFPYPEFVVFRFREENVHSLSCLIRNENDKEEKISEIKETIKNFWIIEQNENKYNQFVVFKECLARSLFDSLMHSIAPSLEFLTMSSESDIDFVISTMNGENFNETTLNWSRLSQLLDDLCKDTKTDDDMFWNAFIDQIKAFMSFIDHELIFNDDINTKIGLNNCFSVSIGENKENKYHIGNGLFKFWQEYKKISKAFDSLLIDFKLSSGEMALLQTFARIFDVIKDEHYREGATLLLLLDEVDMLIHPEWQQKYINSLIEFLKLIAPHLHKQIIITTHSPIMLSDVPRQNVAFFSNEQDKGKVDTHNETFGANIFKLFNDSFFLEEAAIGTYSKKYIIGLIDKIRSIKTADDTDQAIYKIKRGISLIGDPFVKEQLEKMLIDHLPDKHKLAELKTKEAEIKRQIEILESKHNG